MHWDVFCTVIDNFGDIGVCWRLVRDLAARGHTCRLWLDDTSALRWMAPEVGPDGLGHPGIEVRPWPVDGVPLPVDIVPGEVVIEAFGCRPPEAFVARMQRPTPPEWINLEYFSAEAYVERSHGLNSPQFSGAGAGLNKRFFFPGVTEGTGGLLREPGLIERRDALQGSDPARAAALARLGVAWQPGERVVSLFCYDYAPVHAWLAHLERAARQAPGAPPCHVLLTPGPATDLASHWAPTEGSPLRLHRLSPLPQPDFDSLLWMSDLNVVRGEDSAVRALWAGRPHLWQIYRQDDGVHADKLDAFMDHWMADWPAELRAPVAQLWRAFNALAPAEQLGSMADLWAPEAWERWQSASRQTSQVWSSSNDLVSRLISFVTRSG